MFRNSCWTRSILVEACASSIVLPSFGTCLNRQLYPDIPDNTCAFSPLEGRVSARADGGEDVVALLFGERDEDIDDLRIELRTGTGEEPAYCLFMRQAFAVAAIR